MQSKWGGEKPQSPRKGRWSAEEIARFKELYGLKEEAYIARELGRSVASVRRMARQVFCAKPRKGAWTESEISQLKRYMGATSLDIVSGILGRSVEDIQARIAELATIQRKGPWGAEETVEFKRLYGTRSDEDLAIVFGRRLDQVRALARELCISKDKAFIRRLTGGKATTRMPRWTADELELLEEVYPTFSNLEIAKRLGRSVKSVVSKAHNLGLKKDPSRLQEMGRENVSIRYVRRSPEEEGGQQAAGGSGGDAG